MKDEQSITSELDDLDRAVLGSLKKYGGKPDLLVKDYPQYDRTIKHPSLSKKTRNPDA